MEYGRGCGVLVYSLAQDSEKLGESWKKQNQMQAPLLPSSFGQTKQCDPLE
jgi:hypothetical protein